jgi:hypothetical protein
MRIRRLVRNAAFIAVVAMVMGGFTTGIAKAASEAPASTVSVTSVTSVTSGGAITRMPLGCTGFCTYALTTRGLVLIQQFNCTPRPKGYSNVRNPIYQMTNTCGVRVWYFNPNGNCMSPHSSRSGVGRFGTVTGIGISTNTANC